MTNGFSANVAARKPRTGIARVISDMVAPATDADAPKVEQAAPPPPPVELVRETPKVVEPPKEEPKAAEASRAPGAREQVERLRERLAAAARPVTPEVEPQRTATAVREVIEGLRTRLEASQAERSELAKTLEEVRASLARVEGELRKERKTRAAIEVQAEERQRIADDAVAEAEALAAERDQVLSDLDEQRRLESEQSVLLLEAEAVLGRRDAERTASAKLLADAREMLDLRTAEAADAGSRLKAEVAARTRAEARCKELEEELKRLSEATEALEAIDGMTRGR